MAVYTQEQIRRQRENARKAAREFKVFYEKRKTADGYSVDHSGQTYVIDPRGGYASSFDRTGWAPTCRRT